MSAAPDPREPLGRIVHDTRLACEADRAAAEGRQRFNLGSWEERGDGQRELDMRIGAAVIAAERAWIRNLAVATGATCSGDGIEYPFADLLERPQDRGDDKEVGNGRH